ncbi:hypothetical protein ACFLS0_00575 [Candidatus Bipolaricaulota bacterium]
MKMKATDLLMAGLTVFVALTIVTGCSSDNSDNLTADTRVEVPKLESDTGIEGLSVASTSSDSSGFFASVGEPGEMQSTPTQQSEPTETLNEKAIAPPVTALTETPVDEPLITPEIIPTEPSLSSTTSSTVIIGYQLHGTRDASYDSCARIIADVVMDDAGYVSDSDLSAVAQEVVLEILMQMEVDAIAIFFWQPDSGVGQGVAAASVDWGPYGQWAPTDELVPGDYSKHAYQIGFNRTSEYSQSELRTSDRTLSVTKQREIFYNLVALQDRISLYDPRYQEKNQQAKVAIAQQYGISSETLGTIIMEGARNGWPMPPPP